MRESGKVDIEVKTSCSCPHGVFGIEKYWQLTIVVYIYEGDYFFQPIKQSRLRQTRQDDH